MDYFNQFNTLLQQFAVFSTVIIMLTQVVKRQMIKLGISTDYTEFVAMGIGGLLILVVSGQLIGLGIGIIVGAMSAGGVSLAFEALDKVNPDAPKTNVENVENIETIK
jgi:hypothetical protein